MTIRPPSARLVNSKSDSKGQLTESRLNFFENNPNQQGQIYYSPTVTAQTSPSPLPGTTTMTGEWTCPAGVTQLQVECWGGGGGGSGGNATQGGSGGGGGEYACEPQYPVTPGKTYDYVIDLGGAAGQAGDDGDDGASTVFDPQGQGIAGGVIAHGGFGGDTTAGTGGAGGSGSINTQHFNGGAGGSSGNGNTGQDNPLSVFTQAQLHWWYQLDDPALVTSVTDDSGNGLSGGVSNYPYFQSGITTPSAPAPVYNVSNSLNCAYFNQSGVVAIPDLVKTASSMTLSCWVNNNGLGYNGQNMRLISNDHPDTTHTGFDFFIQGNGANAGKPIFKLGTGSNQAVCQSSSSLGTSGWTGWHYLVATWDGSTMKVYVDAVVVATLSYSGTYHYSSTNTNYTAIGINPQYNGDYLTGYMANAYMAVGLAASATYITSAFGSNSPTGGSGGGASGGSAGTGNAGAVASGSSAGTGGAAAAGIGNQTGSAAGGAGGASGVSGNAPAVTGPFAGGGGGAGNSSPPSYTTVTYQPSASATYAGTDSPSGNASQPSTAGTTGNLTQGGNGNINNSLNGTQNAMMVLPSGISTALASATTIESITLSLNVLNGAGAILQLGYINDSTLPATWNGSGATLVKAFQLQSGQATYDLTATGLAAALKSGAALALTFGDASTLGAYNGGNANDYFCSVTGAGQGSLSPTLTVTYTSSTPLHGGAGGSGAIALTYINASGTPVCAIMSAATTDGSGNQYASGYTGTVTQFHPGSSPLVPETWQNISLPAGFTGTARVKKLAESNFALFHFNMSFTSSTSIQTYTFGSFPSASYYPTTAQKYGVATDTSYSSGNTDRPRLTVPTSGAPSISAPAYSTSQATTLQAVVLIPLD